MAEQPVLSVHASLEKTLTMFSQCQSRCHHCVHGAAHGEVVGATVAHGVSARSCRVCHHTRLAGGLAISQLSNLHLASHRTSWSSGKTAPSLSSAGQQLCSVYEESSTRERETQIMCVSKHVQHSSLRRARRRARMCIDSKRGLCRVLKAGQSPCTCLLYTSDAADE